MSGDQEAEAAFSRAQVNSIVSARLQEQRLQFIEDRFLAHADAEDKHNKDLALSLAGISASVRSVQDQFPKEREYFYSKFMTKSEGDELERRLESKIDGIRARIVWTLGGIIAVATLAQFLASIFLQARAIAGG